MSSAPYESSTARSALVTGASSGIGEATALRLASEGWKVFAVARRAERLQSLAEHEGVIPITCDVTDSEAVAEALAAIADAGGIDTLINNAGGALGADTIGDGDPADWRWMFEVNVLGTLNMIQAFLPMLRAHGEGTIVNLTSTAGTVSYEGGGGYNAAKFAEHGLTGALRLEEAQNNIRVIEVLPGMVKTDEFATKRLRGDDAAAAQVYAGVEKPLTAEDVAEVIARSITLPHHVNCDQIVLRPVAQAAQHKVIRSH